MLLKTSVHLRADLNKTGQERLEMEEGVSMCFDEGKKEPVSENTEMTRKTCRDVPILPIPTRET